MWCLYPYFRLEKVTEEVLVYERASWMSRQHLAEKGLFVVSVLINRGSTIEKKAWRHDELAELFLQALRLHCQAGAGRRHVWHPMTQRNEIRVLVLIVESDTDEYPLPLASPESVHRRAYQFRYGSVDNRRFDSQRPRIEDCARALFRSNYRSES